MSLQKLNDLLVKKGLKPAEPNQVLVMRHAPPERELRRALPYLAAGRPDVFNAFQQAQYPRAAKAMKQASFLASFIGHKPKEAVFIGLYKVADTELLSYDEFWKIPANLELKKLGMIFGDKSGDFPCPWFDLQLTETCQDWKGKLIVGWQGERAWCRWADRNDFPIEAMCEESFLVPQPQS